MRNNKGQFIKGIIPKNKSNRTDNEKNCLNCKSKLIKRKTQSWKLWDKQKLCGKCALKSIVGSHKMKHSEKSKRLMSLHKKGQKSWNAGKKFIQIAKEKHPNWKGGINPENDNIRHSLEIKQWRIAVFKRDNYICQICTKRSGDIEADHIKPFSLFPELRFELSNGRTLCKKCHRQTPTYGDIRKLTRQDFESII